MESKSALDALTRVDSADSFLAFAALLAQDAKRSTESAEWQSASAAEFLEAACAWAADSDFGIRPGPPPRNEWHALACFLWAGRGYE